jgi:hypothetical protein
MKKPSTEDLVCDLTYIDPEYKNGIELKPIEERYKCEISFSTEKHNELQYTHFFEVDFGLDEKFFVEIESGINNGTQVNHEEWGVNSSSDTKIIEVLKDIILDMSFYEDGSFLHKKRKPF